ncbi:sec7 domain-containing protein, partial [Cystoisospora suis]
GYIFQLALGLLKYYETELLVNSFEGCLLILNRSIRPDADEEGGFFDRSRFLKCVGLCPVDRNEYAQWLAVQRIQEEKTNLLQLAKRALH